MPTSTELLATIIPTLFPFAFAGVCVALFVIVMAGYQWIAERWEKWA